MNYSKPIVFNTIGNVATLFFQWLIIMLIPKITNFEEAGVFTVAISICSILNHIATFSMREYQISDQRRDYNDKDFMTLRKVTILLSFILIVPFSLLFNYDIRQISAILAYMIYRNLIHYAYIYSAALQIDNHLDRVGLDMTIEGILSFVSFISVYIITSDLVVAIAVMALIGGGFFVLSEKLAYKRYSSIQMNEIHSDILHVRLLFVIGLPLLISLLAPTAITALPKLLLQNIKGEELAGIFGTLSTPTIIIPTLAISIFAPFIIRFSNLSVQGNINRIRHDYLIAVIIITIFGLISCVFALLLQEWVFTLLYGEEIRVYSKYFSVLLLGITAYTIGTIGSTVLLTKKQGRYAALSSSISLLIGVFLCYFMVYKDGLMGATYSLVIVYFIFGFLISMCVYFIPMNNNAFGGDETHK